MELEFEKEEDGGAAHPSKFCSVCQSDLCVDSFSSLEDAKGLHGDSFRLPCGHAFHASCIIESLRFSSNCPTCRHSGGASGAAHGSNTEIRITMHRNQLMITAGGEGDGSSSSSSGEWNELLAQEQWDANPLVKQVRCSHVPTQVARRNLRGALARYNQWRDEIRGVRRRALAAALTRLRRERYREFQVHTAAVGLALRQLARVERSEVARRIAERGHGSELLRVTPYNWGAQDLMRIDWRTTSENTRNTDPCERGFWSK